MRLVQLLRQPEFQIFLFCLLFLLLNWPFLAISANSGLTGIFMYLFVLWALSIFLLFLIQRALKGEASVKGKDNEGGD